MADKKNSDARIKANNKYNAKAYDRINVAVSKGKKAIIQDEAEKRQMSINAFVISAIDEKIERDKQGASE